MGNNTLRDISPLESENLTNNCAITWKRRAIRRTSVLFTKIGIASRNTARIISL